MFCSVDVTPTWEACVLIHMACLENPNASVSAKRGSRNELLRLARYVDNIIANSKKKVGGI